MKKVLVLYAKYGGGHLSAANAIKTYIEDNYFYTAEVKCVDCMEYISPFISKVTTGAYKKLTKSAPQLWKKLYSGARSGFISNVSSNMNKIMAKKFSKLFKDFSPDIIISAHPFSSQMSSYLKEKNIINCKLVTVLTDFDSHDQWLIGREYCDYFFVSNNNMRLKMIEKYNIPSDKIFATGIPLSKAFSQSFNDDEIYSRYKLDKNKKTILFFGGGEFGLGKNKTVDLLKTLTNHLDKYQIIAISGKNKKMYMNFLKLGQQINNKDLHIFDYSNDVPSLMHVADVVITKPGGLTTSESLASHLPIIIINPIPGQEEENAEFLVNSGAAVWIKKGDNVDEIITTLLNDTKKLEDMKQRAIQIAKPNSTMDICDIIFQHLGRFCLLNS